MRILYGVVGEGMGHAMRSRVVLDELDRSTRCRWWSRAAPTTTCRSGPASSSRCSKIWGYTLVYEDNEVQTFAPLLQNLKGAVTGWPQNMRAYFEIAESFAPEVGDLRLRDLELPLRASATACR